VSDIDELVESIQRQLQRNGLDDILSEVNKTSAEIQKIQDFVSNAFLMDFRYDNVERLAQSLRMAQHELNNINKSIGPPESAINEALHRIRDA
jgi:hypothetical protein